MSFQSHCTWGDNTELSINTSQIQGTITLFSRVYKRGEKGFKLSHSQLWCEFIKLISVALVTELALFFFFLSITHFKDANWKATSCKQNNTNELASLPKSFPGKMHMKEITYTEWLVLPSHHYSTLCNQWKWIKTAAVVH